MKQVAFEAKVGMFILIGFLILILMIFSIGDVYLFKQGKHIKVLFNFANGIAMNAPVRVAGIEVGEIDNIRIYYDADLRKTKVELTAWIKKDVRIEEDAKAVINTLGLLGEKYLEIFPGASKSFLNDGSVLVGIDPVPTESMTLQLKEILDSIQIVMDKVKTGEGTVGRFFSDESVYENIEAFTEDIKENPWKLMNKPRD